MPTHHKADGSFDACFTLGKTLSQVEKASPILKTGRRKLPHSQGRESKLENKIRIEISMELCEIAGQRTPVPEQLRGLKKKKGMLSKSGQLWEFWGQRIWLAQLESLLFARILASGALFPGLHDLMCHRKAEKCLQFDTELSETEVFGEGKLDQRPCSFYAHGFIKMGDRI